MVDGRGHLWVTDFGLARFQGEASLTAPGDMLGTLRYMSPEQATADHAVVDQRTDVYSLGATLYELATLRPVFEGSDRRELLRRIAQEEPRRPRAVQPAVPRDLETIILKAMAKEPAARYATAEDLADDLGAVPRRPADHGPAPRSAGAIGAVGAAARRGPGRRRPAAGRGLRRAGRRLRGGAGQAGRDRARARRGHAASATRPAAPSTRCTRRSPTTGWANSPTCSRSSASSCSRPWPITRPSRWSTDADPIVRAEAGVAAFRVGEIQRTLGRTAEAEQAYRQAIEVLEAIPAGASRHRRPGTPRRELQRARPAPGRIRPDR